MNDIYTFHLVEKDKNIFGFLQYTYFFVYGAYQRQQMKRTVLLSLHGRAGSISVSILSVPRSTLKDLVFLVLKKSHKFSIKIIKSNVIQSNQSFIHQDTKMHIMIVNQAYCGVWHTSYFLHSQKEGWAKYSTASSIWKAQVMLTICL